MAKDGLESRLKGQINSNAKGDEDFSFHNEWESYFFTIQSLIDVQSGVDGKNGTKGKYMGPIDASDIDLTLRQFLNKYLRDINTSNMDLNMVTARASLLGIFNQRQVTYQVAGGIPIKDEELDTYRVWEAMVFNTQYNTNILSVTMKNPQGGGGLSDLYR